MKILVVVDVQKDFVDGTLGTKEAVAIIPAVKERIAQAIADGWTVCYTRDTHKEDYLDTDEGKHLPVVHCLEGTAGWQIYDGIYVDGCTVLDKPTFGLSCIGECLMEWFGYEEDDIIEEIELIGLCTDICVISNALLLKSFFGNCVPNVKISCTEKCCAGVTPEKHAAAIEVMKSCQIEVKE